MPSISDIFKKYRDTLPKLELDLLISHATGSSREYVLAHPELELGQRHAERLDNYVARRLDGEPIAYITGQKEFFGRSFFVGKHVLVPRPETELMVDEALRVLGGWLSSDPEKPIHVVDVGTGSGCIILTVAKETDLKFAPDLYHHHIRFTGIDISKRALKAAASNRKKLGLDSRVSLIHGNLLQPLLAPSSLSHSLPTGSKLLILANLPYLTPNQITDSPSIRHEPRLALEAGQDGLKYYRRLFKQISLIEKHNSSIRLEGIMEIDETQTEIFRKMTLDYPFIRLKKIIKDYQGHDRHVVICHQADLRHRI